MTLQTDSKAQLANCWWRIGEELQIKGFCELKTAQTFVVVHVHMDRLALPKSTESNHVLMRVERYTVSCRGVTKLRVHCNLVTWEEDQPNVKQAICDSDFYITGTKSTILTCISIPDICHPILATRKDEVPTRCERAGNPLSVVGGSRVLLYSQTKTQQS